MMHDRAAEIVACCNGIIRNADYIAEEFEFNQSMRIVIDFPCQECPAVTIEKKVIPKELLEVLQR